MEEERLSYHLMMDEDMVHRMQPKQSTQMLYLLGSGVFMSLHALLAKRLTHVPIFELQGLRAIFLLAFLYVQQKIRGYELRLGDRTNRPSVIKVMVLAFLYGYIYLSTIRTISLSESIVLLNSSCLFQSIIHYMVLSEVIPRSEKLSIVILLCGTVGIIRPWEKELIWRTIGCLCGLCGSLILAIHNTIIRMDASNTHPFKFLVLNTSLQIIMCPIIMLAAEQVQIINIMELVMVGLMALFNLVGQTMLIKSIQYSGNIDIQIINYVQVIVTLTYDILIIHDPPRLFSLIAFVLIIFANIHSYRFKNSSQI